MSEIEKIKERWPKIFPLDRTKGELADFIVEANSDIQTLLSSLGGGLVKRLMSL